MKPIIHPAWLRHDLRDLAMWACAASLLANFLPDADRFQRWPRVHGCYVIFVDLIALVALNLRADLPSLDEEFMGFKRRGAAWVRNKRELRRMRRELQERKRC